MKNRIINICFLMLIVMLAFTVKAQEKDKIKLLAPTPPMGWNSWNWFGKTDVNETVVREVIDAFVKEGLRDAGYQYIVIDGGWRDTVLTKEGALMPHPQRFPNGIKALADYAHSKGLKLGVHTAAGTIDCGVDKVGGYGHEEVHVKQFADWGLDFVKLDKCRMQGGWNEALEKSVYGKWSRLLKNCGRDMVFSISAYEFRDWYPEYCHMARTTLDIAAKCNGGAFFDTITKKRSNYSVMHNAEKNDRAARHAVNGYWNDPDILVTGDQGLTLAQQEAHFSLWCIISAPLFLGNDPRHMTAAEKEIILNKTAIHINQDATEQGGRVVKSGYKEVWAKRLANGSTAVLLLNRNQKLGERITLNFKDLGLDGKVRIRTVFDNKSLGSFNDRFTRTIEAQSGLFVILEKAG